MVLSNQLQNWFLELLHECVNLKQAIRTNINREDIESLQAKVDKPFISHLNVTFLVVVVLLVMFCEL